MLTANLELKRDAYRRPLFRYSAQSSMDIAMN